MTDWPICLVFFGISFDIGSTFALIMDFFLPGFKVIDFFPTESSGLFWMLLVLFICERHLFDDDYILFVSFFVDLVSKSD